MRNLKRLWLVAFSIGWLFPIWLAAWLFVDFWQVEGYPQLLGQQRGNSLEWFGLIKDCLSLGFAWMAAAAAYWSWMGMRNRARRSS
jgi:hypothetical protein